METGDAATVTLDRGRAYEPVNQIAVWLQNVPGELAKLSKALSDAGLNIEVFVITEAGRYGIVRFIVRDADAAYERLAEVGFTVKKTEMLVLEVPDRPGQLAEVGESLRRIAMNIEYLYGFPFRKRDGTPVNLAFLDVKDVEAARQTIANLRGSVNVVGLNELEEMGFFAGGPAA
ncbi:MAG: amino acid-binding protein [Parcubacteria group bacterium]|nr:amino acid-binding protein [Parcubacteria group bacterium]